MAGEGMNHGSLKRKRRKRRKRWRRSRRRGRDEKNASEMPCGVVSLRRGVFSPSLKEARESMSKRRKQC